MIPASTVRDLQQNYGAKSLALAIFIGLGFLILGYNSICRGVVLGALCSTLNFVWMSLTLHKQIKANRSKASISALISIVSRYFFIAIPVVVAIKFPERFNLAATIAALFTVQVVILIDNVFRNFLSREGEKGAFTWKN